MFDGWCLLLNYQTKPTRRRDRRRPPLVESSVVGARVHCAVIRIVRIEGRLYDGVELGELYVRSVAQVREEPRCPFGRRLEMHDADPTDCADKSCAEANIEVSTTPWLGVDLNRTRM